jgi:hypothetical protein
MSNTQTNKSNSGNGIAPTSPDGRIFGTHGCCALAAKIAESERVRRKICPLNKRGVSESDDFRGAGIAATRGHTIHNTLSR